MIRCGFKRKLLCPVLGTVLFALIFYEIFDIGDTGLFIDGITLFFASACFIIWMLWWYFSKIKPSIMFKITCLLIGSNVLVLAFQTYARWMLLHDVRWYLKFVQGDWWTYRYILCLFVFIWLFVWVVGRVFGLDEDKPNINLLEDTNILNALIVEDDKTFVKLLIRVFGIVDYFHITVANTIKEARSKFIPGKYACILLDLNLGLSVEDGIQLAKDFRQLDKLAVIVVVSGYQEHILDKRLVSYTDDFLKKPFEVEDLRMRLFSWLVCYRKRL